MTRHTLFVIGLMLTFAAPLSAQTLGTAFTYQGQLKESGQPANGLYDLQACLYDSPVNPTALGCAPDAPDVPVEAGLFTITLDFGSSAFVGQERFLELRVRPGASSDAYTPMLPRQLVRPAPEALRANAASAAPWLGLTGVPAGFADGIDADSGGSVTSVSAGAGLTGGSITASGTLSVDTTLIQSRISNNCPLGQYLRQVNADGTVVCTADANSGGTVTSIATGAGLTGGPISASGSIAIAAGGVGLAQINTNEVQARVSNGCALGTYLRGINADGTVLCSELPGVARITTLDNPANDVGNDASLAIGLDGLPVISYADVSAGVLKVAKCANSACTGAATISVVDDPVNEVGYFSSLAIPADGLPVISYIDGSVGKLKVAKCSNAACSGVATISLVDAATTVGQAAIAIGHDDLPVIAYYESTASTLKVAKCSNAACSGAVTLTTVDANPPGDAIDIAIGDDGRPVISYLDDAGGGLLKVAKCANAACTGAAVVTTVDSNPAIILTTSIAIGSDGRPLVSYHDGVPGSLKVAHCANTSCTGAATITTVDGPATHSGNYSSIGIGSDGLPVISYNDLNVGAIKVARCANAGCTGAATITTLDESLPLVASRSSLAIGRDGLPVIGYRGDFIGTLVVAKCGTLSCR
ncbi:MAG TPA: hypothetical protein PLQ74_05185 [Pseudomonadota bacterium]|nr:hypothetical protein [Pseudomonadota bacterium]